MTEFKLMALCGNLRKEVKLQIEDMGESLRLTILIDGSEHSAEQRDAWQALRVLRSWAEGRGIFICCNGARVDAYPSRMSLAMSRGFSVYLHRFGESAAMEDLVGTFAHAEPGVIGSISAQDLYHEKWLESLDG